MPTTPRPAPETTLRAALVRVGIATLVLATPLLMGGTGGCSGGSGRKGVGEPCTRSSECSDALVCVRGVCRAEVDASP